MLDRRNLFPWPLDQSSFCFFSGGLAICQWWFGLFRLFRYGSEYNESTEKESRSSISLCVWVLAKPDPRERERGTKPYAVLCLFAGFVKGLFLGWGLSDSCCLERASERESFYVFVLFVCGFLSFLSNFLRKMCEKVGME